MRWQDIRTHWDHLRGDARRTWPRLMDEELEVVRGRREVLIDKVRDAYHHSHEEAEREVDVWAEGLSPARQPM